MNDNLFPCIFTCVNKLRITSHLVFIQLASFLESDLRFASEWGEDFIPSLNATMESFLQLYFFCDRPSFFFSSKLCFESLGYRLSELCLCLYVVFSILCYFQVCVVIFSFLSSVFVSKLCSCFHFFRLFVSFAVMSEFIFSFLFSFLRYVFIFLWDFRL